MMKHKKKIIAFLSVGVTIFFIAGISFAWFFMNKDVELKYGSDVVCEAGKSLELSIDGGQTWSGRLEQKGISAKLLDVSGNGQNLYKPQYLDENNKPVNFQDAVTIDSDGYGDYIEFSVMLRSTSPMDIYLGGDSYINPKNISDSDRNIFGRFSKDFIAGAMRVAVIENGNLKLIWAPNPNFQLTREANGKYNFNSNGIRETSYTYYNGTTYYTVSNDDYANKRFVYGSTGSTALMANSSPILTTLTPQSGEFDIKTVTLRIWFEGTDREADQALSGGCVEMNFKFSGLQKPQALPEKQKKIDAIKFNDINKTFSGLDTDMVFSTDGCTWTKYSGANLPNLAANFTLYFKYPENQNYLETSYNKIEKTYT